MPRKRRVVEQHEQKAHERQDERRLEEAVGPEAGPLDERGRPDSYEERYKQAV